MSKHTPGPWVAGKRTEYGTHTPGLVFAGKDSVAQIMGAPINGVLEEMPAKYAEQFANARLIAAAPDLLDAVRVLAGYPVEEFGAKKKPNQKLFGANDWGLFVRDVLAARAAIAKAEGA